MFSAVIPSRQLIAIAASGAVICTALAFTSIEPAVVERAALAGGVLIVAACVADVLLSVLIGAARPSKCTVIYPTHLPSACRRS